MELLTYFLLFLNYFHPQRLPAPPPLPPPRPEGGGGGGGQLRRLQLGAMERLQHEVPGGHAVRCTKGLSHNYLVKFASREKDPHPVLRVPFPERLLRAQPDRVPDLLRGDQGVPGGGKARHGTIIH